MFLHIVMYTDLEARCSDKEENSDQHMEWANQKRNFKKTRQGQGRHTKFGHKGGGSKGSTSSHHYKKKYI